VKTILARHEPIELAEEVEEGLADYGDVISKRSLEDYYSFEMPEKQDWDNIENIMPGV
jgi:hypothetical protein